jgi:signal transduction histidine kinase
MKKLIILILTISFIFGVEYTKKEKEFLKNHPVIYFSAMEYWPVDENGNSIHTNFLKLINKYGHLNIQPIYYKYWSEGFEAAKNGKTEGIMALSYSKNRTKYFYFTKPYNYHPYYLIVKKDSDIGSFKDLKNKTVYIAKHSIIREILKNPDFKIVWSKTPYKNLAQGKIDAILTFYMPKNKYIKEFKVTKVFINKSGEEHIGISKNYPVLYSIIQKVIKEIPYDEIEKIKEKYYYNPMPPVTIVTPKVTLKELISPIDILILIVTIGFLFFLIYVYITKKYLHLKLKNFLIAIFTIESFILGMIIYETVMLNFYSNKILEIKSRSFNELFLTDKIEEAIIKLNNEFERKLNHQLTKYPNLFKNNVVKAENLKVLDHTLHYYLSPKFFHPATLSRLAKIKLILKNLISLQQEVEQKRADISIYNTNFKYLINQIILVRNYIKNENDKEINLIKEKIKYQFMLLISVTLIFILANILLFIMIKKKIYNPITYLIEVIQKHKEGKNAQRKEFYNDEVGIMIKEFFDLQNKLNVTINELQEHKNNLEDKVKLETSKRLKQEEVLLHQSRLALMGEMIDAIAHQWKQPLSIITLYLALLQKDPSNIANISESIQNQIKHMTNTLDEFRSFFKEKEKQKICVQNIVDKTLLLLKDELTKNQIEIETKIDKNFCLEGIENEFIHLLITILSNAKEIFKERNIEKRKISISAYEDENYYYLSIEDNAGGIEEKILDKIFDLKFTTRKGGSGVGLYLAKQIALKHTGDLIATNTKNGAKFIFKIRK